MAINFTTSNATGTGTIAAPMTDAQFVALMLPAGVNFNRNGINTTVTDVIASVLAMPEVNGVKELALAILFESLESDHMQSETIGKYSYAKWKMRGSEFWRLQAASVTASSNAPNVGLRPSNFHNRRGCLS